MCVAAAPTEAAAVEESVVTESAQVVQVETSEPTVESTEDSDDDDEQTETVTDAGAADQLTRHTQLATGKTGHPPHSL